ncbi:MAG: hypothetical protein AAB275_07640, partial [Deltaproteobacteria bacterium]
MIINIFTIISLFIAAVSLVLAIFQAGVSLFLYKNWGSSGTGEERTKLEDFAYLVLLIASVILMVRLLSWPLFYATLNSYVPEIQGAMCVAGVTQIKAGMARLLQTVKPLVFFAVGGWLLLNMLDRTTKTSPLMKRKFLLLSVVSLLVIGDSLGEIIFLFKVKATSSVACCTTIFDVPTRSSAMIPKSIFGEGYGGMMIPIYYASNAIVIGLIGILLWTGSTGLIALSAAFLLALLSVPVTGICALEKIAPTLMELPYHHCLYCFPRNVPDGAIIMALFVLGTFSAGWALMLKVLGMSSETGETLNRYIRNLL